MKKLLCILLSSLLVMTVSACNSGETVDNSDIASSESETSVDVTANASEKITTLDYKNKGKMGDVDGPAFAVYSKVGYNGASVDLNLADMEIKNVLPDGRHINGYCFLGADIFEDGYWANCVDAGLCWSGTDGGWHLFYNIYETLNEDTSSWYESNKKLPKNGTYRMTFKMISDNYATLTVESLTGSFKDSVRVELKGAKADGSNTAFLFNTALDYPPNTKVDTQGNPSEDWTEITLANSDKGLYLRKLRAFNMKLFKENVEEDWINTKNSAVSIWPDKSVSGFDYSPTEIFLFDGSEYYINLDMNRD